LRSPIVGVEVIATKRKGLSPLERELLKAAAERPGGVVWLSQESLDTLSQTYKAMLRLEKLEFLERRGKDALRWRITKAGKTELKESAPGPGACPGPARPGLS
jgi:virulence-associated protein VapD